MNHKNKQSKYYTNVNVGLMVKNVTRIDAGITVTVEVSVTNVMHVEKVKFRILLQVIVKMENILQILWMN